MGTGHQGKLLPLLALIAGAMLPLAFAPFHWYPIAFFSPALLLYVWLRSTAWQATWRGFLFGVGFFGVGTSWVYISIHNFGNANVALAGFVTALFVFILALFPATQGFIFARLFGRSRFTAKCLMVFPALWVLWEWVRSWIFTGFPWMFLGYSQIHSLLRGYAPFFGVYGVSLAVAFISGCVVVIFTHKSYRVRVASAAGIFFVAGIGTMIATFHWTKPIHKSFKVSLVQGNVPEMLKWDREYLLNTLKIYKTETEKHWDSKIIVWPEAAMPVFPSQIAPFLQQMNNAAKKHKTALVFGIPTRNSDTNNYFNSLMVIGNGKGLYLKRHLVPFGEYIPLGFIFSKAMKYFNIPMSGFSPGPKKQAPLTLAGIPTAAFICYEIAYPMEVLNSVKNTQLIVVVSDDSWFGESIASAQQVEIAQMRALETGRYILYATNTGITAVIDPNGKIKVTLPENKRAVLTTTVTPMVNETYVMFWHYYPVFIMILFLLIFSFFL